MKNDGNFKISTVDGILVPPDVIPWRYKGVQLFTHNYYSSAEGFNSEFWVTAELLSGRVIRQGPSPSVKTSIQDTMEAINHHGAEKIQKEAMHYQLMEEANLCED